MSNICTIEDCESPVLARSWCRKHYARWKSHGDPLGLAGDREPNLPVESSRFIGSNRVHFTTAGDPFVFVQRKRKDGVAETRRYGVVINCENCGKEAFIKNSGGKKDRRFCSHKCAGPVVARQRKKKGSSVRSADALFSTIVRSRGGSCRRCGTTDRLQCAHGFSRRYRNVRWDYRNAFCLCAGCHMYFTYRPIEWDDWLRAEWGNDLYDEIRATALQTTKADAADVLARLRDDWRAMEGFSAVSGHKGWTGLEHRDDV